MANGPGHKCEGPAARYACLPACPSALMASQPVHTETHTRTHAPAETLNAAYAAGTEVQFPNVREPLVPELIH